MNETGKGTVLSLGYLIYQLTGWLVFIAVSPFFFLYYCLSQKNRIELKERLGFLEQARPLQGKPLRIWLHAASVGEVQVARALTAEIRKQLPGAAVILTTVTRQGQAVAKKQMDGDVLCLFAPLDLAGVATRAVAAIRPDIYVCLETELWPNILRAVEKFGAKLVLLNGRMSARSHKRYKKIKGLMGRLLGRFSAIAVIRRDDAERFIDLGARPEAVTVAGNAKYDLASSRLSATSPEDCRKRLNVENGQAVWVAGSTHTGEESLLLEVYVKLKEKLPRLVWIVAPRHPRRLAEVEALFSEHRIAFDRLSRLRKRKRRHDVVLVDTMGELAGLYSIATYVFCGGSLVERGGHNVFEAAVWEKPVLYGPSMKDFADAKELLESAGGGFQVGNPRELYEKMAMLADQPELYAETARKARRAALAQQGSARRQAAILKKLAGRKTAEH